MFVLPDLPYPYDALSPFMSERTLHFHHDKHHKAYVTKLNALVEETGERAGSLEDLITARAEKRGGLYNNAAQAWNHAFFWRCMTPSRGEPAGELATALGQAFGDIGRFSAAFVKAGAAHFGSGWVWLAADRSGRLTIETTHDAGNLVAKADRTPLLTCDLWEHAYYLDRQNDRPGFLKAWIDSLADWEFAGRQFASAAGKGEAWRYSAPKVAAESV